MNWQKEMQILPTRLVSVVVDASVCPGVPDSLEFPFPERHVWVPPPLSGNGAKEACQALGGHLASFKTQEEANIILGFRGLKTVITVCVVWAWFLEVVITHGRDPTLGGQSNFSNRGWEGFWPLRLGSILRKQGSGRVGDTKRKQANLLPSN